MRKHRKIKGKNFGRRSKAIWPACVQLASCKDIDVAERPVVWGHRERERERGGLWLEDAVVDVEFVYARGALSRARACDCSLRLKSREALLNGELADFESTDIFTERRRGGTLIESRARPLMALEMFLLGRNETERG